MNEAEFDAKYFDPERGYNYDAILADEQDNEMPEIDRGDDYDRSHPGEAAIYDSYAAEYEENEARAHSLTDTCTHDEWHWDGEMRVCSICYKPLCGIDYTLLDKLEREYEERMEAEADSYVPDGF